MMIHVPKVLTPEQVAECRRLLDSAEWTDGKATVGRAGRAGEDITASLPELSPVGRQLGELILTALSRNPLFFSAALPLKTVPPLFNRYEGGEQYGMHIDGAVRAVPGSSHFIRTDLSSTLFLTDPADYDGGELVVVDTYGQHEVKLPAGDLILYTSGSLHRVNPVTRGARVARSSGRRAWWRTSGTAKRCTSSIRPSRRSAANTARRTRPWRWRATITTFCGCGRRSEPARAERRELTDAEPLEWHHQLIHRQQSHAGHGARGQLRARGEFVSQRDRRGAGNVRPVILTRDQIPRQRVRRAIGVMRPLHPHEHGATIAEQRLQPATGGV